MLNKSSESGENFQSKQKGNLYEVRQIPADFDAEAYLELHPDVKQSGIDPALHYIEFGQFEGRAYRKTSVLEEAAANFCKSTPNEKNAFDIFPTSWNTIFDEMTIAHFDGTRDVRIEWLRQKVNLNNIDLLELGPLEAAHTAILERAGANVYAIESNIGAFIRCLIVKNYLNLRAKFVLGDFEKWDFSSKT